MRRLCESSRCNLVLSNFVHTYIQRTLITSLEVLRLRRRIHYLIFFQRKTVYIHYDDYHLTLRFNAPFLRSRH